MAATVAACSASDTSARTVFVPTRGTTRRRDTHVSCTLSRRVSLSTAAWSCTVETGILPASSARRSSSAINMILFLTLQTGATSAAPDSGAVINATHGVLSPKLGSLVRVTPDLGIYANVSRGFRSANGVISDPTLVPITSWAYETGLKFDHEGANASVALFRMDVSNEQTFNPVTLASTSGGASRRQGVELDWRIPVAAFLTTSGTWTFNDARYRSLLGSPSEGSGGPVVLDGLRVYNSSKYIGSAALDLVPGARSIRFRVSGNWTGPSSALDQPRVVVAGYGLLHASASAPVDRFDIEVGLRDVLDRAYPELIAGHIVSPGQPRTVYLSVRAHID